MCFSFFFFNDLPTPEIYTLSLHDALPILNVGDKGVTVTYTCVLDAAAAADAGNYSVEQWNYNWTSDYGSPEVRDRKSTRLNSSHGYISYAVFCLKKKKKITNTMSICN